MKSLHALPKSNCLLFLGLSTAWLLSAGCVLKTGVGDPATSKADASLVGYWIDDAHEQLITVVAFDKSTYLVDWMAWSGPASDPRPNLRALNKAWVTRLGDATYVTLKMLIPRTEREQVYAVMKVDMKDDLAVARALQQSIPSFEQAQTPAQLARAIEAHQNDAQAFSEPATYRKTTADVAAPILKAFHSSS